MNEPVPLPLPVEGLRANASIGRSRIKLCVGRAISLRLPFVRHQASAERVWRVRLWPILVLEADVKGARSPRVPFSQGSFIPGCAPSKVLLGLFIETALNLFINLGEIDIFTVLTLPTPEHLSFHLF